MSLTRGTDVSVAVVDSGWQRSARDARVQAGVGFLSRARPFQLHVDADDDDHVGHGTLCTQVISSMAPSAKITPLRVFGESLQTSLQVLCSALEWAAGARFDLVNLSLTTVREDSRDRLYRVCSELARAGTIVIAAGRNGFDDGYPAVFDNVIGVTTSHAARQGALAWEPVGPLDIAISKGMLSPFKGDGAPTRVLDSSIAAALVTGMAARILQKRRRLTIDALRRCLDQEFGLVRSKTPAE